MNNILNKNKNKMFIFYLQAMLYDRHLHALKKVVKHNDKGFVSLFHFAHKILCMIDRFKYNYSWLLALYY